MKAFFTNIRNLAALVAFMSCLSACESRLETPEDGRDENEDGTESMEGSYRSYIYGDKEYPITSAYYYMDDDYMFFVFSPVESGKERTTYMDFGLYRSFEGKVVDVTHYYHNDDYYFIYEDPLHFYPQTAPLREGTIYVNRNAEEADSFTVKIDVVLADGTPLSMDYDGPLKKVRAGGLKFPVVGKESCATMQ